MKPTSLPAALNWFFAGEIFLIAIFYHFLPELTRSDIFFAITVTPGYRRTAEARRTLRRFRLAVWLHSFVALALVLVGAATGIFPLLLAGVFWQIIGAFLAFRIGRKKTMVHAMAASPQREAALAPRASGILGHRVLQTGPFVILAAVAIYVDRQWARIPDRFPVHWGLNGEPNGWSNRSLLGVFGPWLIGLATCAGLALMAYATVHWSRQIYARGAAADREGRFRQTQLGVLLGVEYLLAALCSWVTLMPLRLHPQQTPAGISFFVLGTLAFVVAVFGVSMHVGQGGENLQRAGADTDLFPAASAVVGDRTPDSCWKAGMFYFNRADPAVLVEQRFGIGYALNFGNPRAWATLAVICLIPIVVALLSLHSK